MKYCQSCKTLVPDQNQVCPRCKSDKHVKVFGSGSAGTTTVSSSASASPSRPNRTVASDTDRAELQFTLGTLERRLASKKRRSVWLFLAALVALIACGGAWWAHHTMTVMSYATIDPDARLERDPLNPERLTIRYRPMSEGRLGFGRSDRDRDTELVDHVAAGTSSEQSFRWRWSGVKTGDTVWLTHRVGWSLSRLAMKVPEPPPRPKLGDAVMIGQVADATTNKPIESAEVRIVGTSLRSRTDSDGRFRIEEAPASVVGVEVAAPNFSTEQFEKTLVDHSETSVRTVLSPGLKAGQIRVVLTWNDKPADLDAHLMGPLPGNKSFHVYFGAKGDLKSKEFVSLDVDDRDGEGPETITVLGVLPGRYHYFVHDYTNANSVDSTALSNSGAVVKVYHGGQTYRFRTDKQSIGNHWHVCDIDVSADGSATVRKIDKYETKVVQTAITAVDVLFLMDTTNSMNSSIEGLKQNCVDFAETVASGQRDCRLGLIGFGDRTIDEPIYVFPPVADARLFQEKVRDVPRTQGGDTPESPIDALEEGMQIPFRERCVKVFVLITDAPCHREEDIPEIAKELRKQGIKTHVVAAPTTSDRSIDLSSRGQASSMPWAPRGSTGS